MTMQTDQKWIERAEAARDLRSQLGSLASDEEAEVQFMEWSPGRKLVTVWNTETGEEVTLPRYQALAAVNSLNTRGDGWMWTAHKDNAPKAKVNSTKCFLHPDSPEREFLNSIGIGAVCLSEHLASNASKWAHARNRHGSAFQSYQEEMARLEREEARAEQRQQTEAMLKIAGRDAEDAPQRRARRES